MTEKDPEHDAAHPCETPAGYIRAEVMQLLTLIDLYPDLEPLRTCLERARRGSERALARDASAGRTGETP